jgi:hypothetical protein
MSEQNVDVIRRGTDAFNPKEALEAAGLRE